MADLQTFVLAARKSLIREAEEQLLQVFGLKSTGEFLPETEVPALTRGKESKEALETRRRLKQLLKDEQDSGITPINAIRKLTKEVAFTHLNRLVALKLLEGGKLIRGAINKWHNSNAFLLYLPDHEQDQRLFDEGSQPTDDRDEGPSDRAYRHFLLWQFGNLAEEVKVLFDPDNIASRLFPRPMVLRSLLNELNAEDLSKYWEPGNEETLGWVYQAFNSEELEAAFTAARQSGKKFAKEDIASVTQLFTPRLAVRFLVENSLGRLWVDMHPDSRVAEKLSYLVMLPAGSHTPKMKSIREIRLLDPATGTMHFGLVAFDWLVEMYREELYNAGKPGWPSEPSVKTEGEIPSAILANNLFGIDIDLRAVQLSALALYLRAKQLNKNARLTESRLACSDIAIFRGQHLTTIANEMDLPEGVTHHLLAKFCDSVDEAAQMGSLVRLENHFQNIEAERLRAAIDSYVVKKAAEGKDESYFGNETSKGLRLLDLLTQKYDIVFTNPPYISSRKMNSEMTEFMKSNYPDGKGDLYAAFIQRCLELVMPDGYLAMLTMHSFMFIGSYGKLRGSLTANSAIRSIAHFGPGLFAVGNPGTLQTAAFVLQRDSQAIRQQDEVGIYFRLVKEPDAQRKQVAFEEAVSKFRKGELDTRTYKYRQGDFSAIDGSPWVYWISADIRSLFVKNPKLIDKSDRAVGQNTGDNLRFLRHWWEVGNSRIAHGYRDRVLARQSDLRWFPYMKGGVFRRWFGNQSYVINWLSEGDEVKAYASQRNKGKHWSRYIVSLDCIFRSGITYSYLTAGKFSARLLPHGFVFDVSGSAFFPLKPTFVLGCMNSSVAYYFLKLINPTINFQAGDVSRLPLPLRESLQLTSLVEEAVSISRAQSDVLESTYDFVAPAPWLGGAAEVARRESRLSAIDLEVDEEVYRLYDITEADRSAIENELSVFSEADEVPAEEENPEDEETELESGAPVSSEALAKAWISYSVGIALNRFRPGESLALGRGSFSAERSERLRELSSEDGMMVLEKGHPDDLAEKVLDILRAIHGDRDAENIVHHVAGMNGELRGSIEGFLLGPFFKEHVQQYRKRPVYWLLQSPKRQFSVYLFHERANVNTLSVLQGKRYLGGRIHRTETLLAELLSRVAKAEGREKTALGRQAREIAETIEDLKVFDAQLESANQVRIAGSDGQQKTARWEPELDDGVLINAAPLHELTPAWKKADSKLDLKKTWNELEAGKYEWTRTAMRYWPSRVLKACKENKSFAIAHGLN